MRNLLQKLIPISVPALLTSSLLASQVSMHGCAVDGCVVDPSDPRCTGVAVSDITLLTGRLAKSGGRLHVTVKNLGSGERITAKLGPEGPMVTFMTMADGVGVVDVTQAMLASIPPGPLTITVQAGTKTLTQTLHIYVPASFVDSAKATVSTGARQPSWVQASQGHVFSTLDNGSDKRINEYQVSGTTLQQLTTRDTHLNLIPSSVLLDISDTQTIRLSPQSGQNYSLESAELNSTSSAYTLLKTLTYSKADWLAVDRKSVLVAVAGEGTDGPLKAFSLPSAGQTPVAVNLNGMPSGKQPVRIGWGFIDNDTQTDLVAVHADGSFAVYLQKSGQGLTFDQNLSTALQSGAELQGTSSLGFSVGDVDRDGLDDVIIVQNMQVTQLANEGNGTFSKTTLLSGVGADAVAVGDVTGDGKADLVLAQKAATALVCYTNQSP